MSRYILLFVVLMGSSVSYSGEFNISRDLISIHYDFAPDRDDGHASAAARSLMGKYDANFIVVTGAVGLNRNQYIRDAGALQDRIWGVGNHLNAYENWELSVDTAARYWGGIIEQGGFVYVAEGGQSDFTADVYRRMVEYGFDRLTDESVVVVQHSVWNEDHTTPADLQYVRRNTDYVKIADGNGVNETADLNMMSAEFVAWSLSSVFGGIWEAAFAFLDPVSRKLDFSDTVELLYILDIGKDRVSDTASFGRFVEGSEVGGINVDQGVLAGDAAESIVVEAENFVEADNGWTLLENREGSSGGRSVKLLPDTRVTHSDPLIVGENFWGAGGEGPELSYRVEFESPGEYLVTVRAFSTGTEDNSIHVGINDEFPESGQRMQWCDGKNQWTESSAQRTDSNHCGVRGSIRINVPRAGVNTINFSAREDGFEFDLFRLDRIQDNGTVLSNETIADLSSQENILATVEVLRNRAEAAELAFEECGRLPAGIQLTRCTEIALDEFIGNEDSVTDLIESGQTDVCSVEHSTLGGAREIYADRCSARMVDCDPNSNGGWTCSSIQIGSAAPRYRSDFQDDRVAVSSVAVVQRDDDVVGNDLLVGGNVGGGVVSSAAVVSDVKTAWSDSYSVDGQCYCDSTFDHSIGDVTVDTPLGFKTIREVCGAVASEFGQGSVRDRVYYNTIQCGHEPNNGFFDEIQCPGYPSNDLNYTGPGCGLSGARFNVDSLFALDDVSEDENLSVEGSWWKPLGTDDLSWYMQFQGELIVDHDADVYFIDGDVDRSVVDSLKSQGKKVMCYMSAGSAENWRSDYGLFPDTVKGNDYLGWPGEIWLDIRNLDVIGPIMEARMDSCMAKGFDGIDADNVNGYVNGTGFNISREDTISYIKWLADEAHQRGMAYSLKNAEELAPVLVGDVDMLQSESCFVYNNCSAAKVIRDANKPVFMVEYENVTRDWEGSCEAAKDFGFSGILRDVLLTGGGVYRQCD